MAKRFITGSLPTDGSYYSLQFEEGDDVMAPISRKIAKIIANSNTVISAFGHAITNLERDSPRFVSDSPVLTPPHSLFPNQCKTIRLNYDIAGNIVGAQFGAGGCEKPLVSIATLFPFISRRSGACEGDGRNPSRV